jgi:hypothetical protein
LRINNSKNNKEIIMSKTYFNLNLKLIAITILLGLSIAACSKDEKCYTCEGYVGTLKQKTSNICGIGPGGEPLVNYYLNMGWNCYESGSSSKSASSITGPEESGNNQTQLTETEDSDCPCKNKEEQYR